MIQLSRFSLRPFTLEDVGPYYNSATHTSIRRNMTDKWPGFSGPLGAEAKVKEFMDTWPPTHLVASRKGEFIGMICLEEPITGYAESVGYAIPSMHGVGHGVDALPAMAAYGFDVLGHERIYSLNLLHNSVMKKILERAGYKHCGIVARGKKDGRPCNQDLYIVSRETLKLPKKCVIDYQYLIDLAPAKKHEEA